MQLCALRRMKQGGEFCFLCLDSRAALANGSAGNIVKGPDVARKDRLDAFGVSLLLGVALLLAFNQVIVKWVNVGVQPVFNAGLRSVLATFFLGAWLWLRGRPPRLARDVAGQGLLLGVLFAIEFLCFFLALDLTTISRAAIIFYSMPVWLAIMAHFGLEGERLSRQKFVGLVLAFLGTALAIHSGAKQGQGGQGSLVGDLLALVAAIMWASTAFLARRPSMAKIGPELQLFWMVLVSGPVLLMMAPFFGPLIRDLQPVHLVWLVFQSSVVVAMGFVVWLWLLSSYPTSTVASFSFLTPIFGLMFGWLVFGETITAQILGAAFLVALGIILINRRTAATGRGSVKIA